MNRRRFLQLSGGAVGLGSLATGTGAFTSVNAERKINIAVADDEDAYLSLNAVSPKGRSFEFNDPEQVAFEIPGNFENTQANGLGQQSTYEFDDLVEIRNQGDDEVVIWSSSSPTETIDQVLLTASKGILDSKNNGKVLSPGDGFIAGLLIDVSTGTGSFNNQILIRANQTGSDYTSS